MGCSGDREKGQLDESQKWDYVVSVIILFTAFNVLANKKMCRPFLIFTLLVL